MYLFQIDTAKPNNSRKSVRCWLCERYRTWKALKPQMFTSMFSKIIVKCRCLLGSGFQSLLYACAWPPCRFHPTPPSLLKFNTLISGAFSLQFVVCSMFLRLLFYSHTGGTNRRADGGRTDKPIDLCQSSGLFGVNSFPLRCHGSWYEYE